MIVNERTSRLYKKKRDIECILKIISQDNAVYDILLGILATVKKDIREDNHMNMMIQQCREQELHEDVKEFDKPSENYDDITVEELMEWQAIQNEKLFKQWLYCDDDLIQKDNDNEK